jgi:cysteine desulfurase/selenocysteine lyase
MHLQEQTKLHDVSSEQIASRLLHLSSGSGAPKEWDDRPCLLDHVPNEHGYGLQETVEYVPHFETHDESIDSEDAGKKLLDMAIDSTKEDAPTPRTNPQTDQYLGGRNLSPRQDQHEVVRQQKHSHPHLSHGSRDQNHYRRGRNSLPDQDLRTTDQYFTRIQELSSRLSLHPKTADSVKSALNSQNHSASEHPRTNPPQNQVLNFRSRRFDVKDIRKDFPVLNQSINGHSLVWFDNAATTQKPRNVIESLNHFYSYDYSNIHRAAHTLAARSTDAYEDARQQVADLINADKKEDIVFVRGTTEGINFIANITKSFLRDKDEIILSELEHHANIVPWQLVAKETGARIRVVPINDRGEIIFDEYRRLLSSRTKIVSLTHASNTLGTILPIAEMTQLAKRHNAWVVIDGAQSIAHLPVDVKTLECDFFVFSGHKVFAPTGIGAVYVRPELQDKLPPWQGGGNMIVNVRFDDTTYADAPAKFEAGTPSIADAIGLGAAIRYLRQFSVADLEAHEHTLLEYATKGLQRIRGVTTYGAAAEKVGVVSFTLAGYDTVSVGKELDRHGIAVRTGHHCSQPSLRHFGLEATIRPSFALYNTLDEVERLLEVIRKLAK